MSGKPTSFILLVTLGILRDRQMRRTVLFCLVAVSLSLLGAGALLLDSWLNEHPLAFLLYWGACLWLTGTALLLALYDLLALRSEAARERQRLKRQVFGEDEGDRRP